MSVEEVVDQLDELVESAFSFPLSNGKVLVDAEKIRRLLEDIRLNLPKDIRQAERIVADRTQIISDARKEAESIVRVAEERARTMVAKDEIVRQAQEKANDLLTQTKTKSVEVRKAANEYVDDLMQRADESVSVALSELRKARQNIKASQRLGDGTKPH
ncbi:MAG: ATPase [Acutalibacteraceae bacterium]|jgi:vacuolar-type H+-ATPase subunit H